MPLQFIRYACLVCLVFIAGPKKLLAQNSDRWFLWDKPAALPVEQGLSHAITGISNGALVVAGGSHFNRRIQEGGKKLVNDKIYVATDPDRMNWREVGRLPCPVSNAAVVPWGNGLLVIGGTNGVTATDRVFLMSWDVNTNRVEIDSSFPKLPVPLSSPSAARCGKNIFVGGGQLTDNTPQKAFYSLEFAEEGNRGVGTWKVMPTWPGAARFGAAMVAQSNGEYDCIYLAGGKGAEGYLKDAFVFDVKRKQWKEINSLPRPAFFSASMALGQTHIVLFSGSDGHDADIAIAQQDNYHMVKDVLAYHTITNTWIKPDNVPTGVAGATALRWNNKLMLVGGELRPGVRTPQIQVATIQTAKQKSKFGWIDYSTLVLYLLILALISYSFSIKKKASSDYLLGSKNIPFWAAGISIMATQVSAIGFMSIPAKAYAVNWAYFAGVFTWFIAVPIVTRAYIPFVRKLNVASAYHYLEARFGPGARLFAACVFVLFQLARMGLVLYLPALALAAVTPLDTITCILIMGVLSTVYTVMGGIEAVIWIEVAQAILLFGGAVVCIILAVMNLNGGISDFFSSGIADQKFSLGQADWGFTSSTLFVILIGNIFIRLGNLTSDQAVVQRYMTTRSLKQAQRSVWADVAVSIPWAIVIYSLGTALYVFYKQHPGKLNPSIATDGILPMFIAQQAPAGLSGLIIAAIFAASMSALEGSMHSVATIFTTDFYSRYRKDLTTSQITRVAKITTVVLGAFATGLSIALVFLDINSILDVFQELTGLFIGASTALFLLGIFTKKANANGVLIGAFSSGIILYFVKTFTPLNFWLYSAVGFLSCYVIGYLASCIIPGRRGLQGLTYYTMNDNLKDK
ncbi:sodium/solute symporter [Pseudoflavitalea sp. X16]|uniref:sodium:solute symporter family transporter n=1 Tax=Paraflavitalea devenefica TaxID=2716334 RepID=UPI0014243DF9|nr:sodium/solute symporter [Paraflavitalea devenefica]NII29369.1 sodium/solute symporter [Paraflavitalea devenefica]